MSLTEAEEIEAEIIRRDLAEKLRDDKKQRLQSGVFYKILNKDWDIIPYYPNEYQIALQTHQHVKNIILKARQLWFSTEIGIEALDFWLTHPWTRVGIIAQDKGAAEDIFRDKLMIAWKWLPKNIKDRYEVSTENVRELWLKDKKTKLTTYITVATSFRSGTLQFLRISEFWKISAKYPAKAREIVSWALEAVGKDWIVFIESTAEWNEWPFYNMFTKAEENRLLWKDLTNLDYKPFFFAWWENKEYELAEDADVLITREDMNYFKSVEEECHIKLSIWQKKWYIKKKEVQQDDMGREYPSYIEEAFDLAVEWAYYKTQLDDMRKQGRICDLPYNKDKPVYCVRDLWWFWWWDEMAIIFYQKVWEWIHIIDAESATWYSLEWFQTEFVTTKWYKIVEDWFPHDWKRTESNWKTVSQNAREIGIPVRQMNIGRVSDWINELKKIFYKIKIDETNCAWFIKSLSNYKRQRDDKRGMFLTTPYHNRASHYADAARYLAVTYSPDQNIQAVKEKTYRARIEKWKRKFKVF